MSPCETVAWRQTPDRRNMRESTEKQRLEQKILELRAENAALQKDLTRVTSDAKYARRQMESYRNKNMQLSAAQELRAGAVSH